MEFELRPAWILTEPAASAAAVLMCTLPLDASEAPVLITTSPLTPAVVAVVSTTTAELPEINTAPFFPPTPLAMFTEPPVCPLPACIETSPPDNTPEPAVRAIEPADC